MHFIGSASASSCRVSSPQYKVKGANDRKSGAVSAQIAQCPRPPASDLQGSRTSRIGLVKITNKRWSMTGGPARRQDCLGGAGDWIGLSVAWTVGRPAIVLTSPQVATTKPAPAAIRSSRTGSMRPVGALSAKGALGNSQPESAFPHLAKKLQLPLPELPDHHAPYRMVVEKGAET